MPDQAYWERLTLSAVQQVTPEQATAIATRARLADEAGTPVGVWHAAAIELGFESRCPCHPCTVARESTR